MRRTVASSLAVLFVLQCCEAFQFSSAIAKRASRESHHHTCTDSHAATDRRLLSLQSSSSLLEEVEVAVTTSPAASSTDTDAAETREAAEPASTTELPSILQDIVDERREFEINLGRAMDTLRKDYPHILHRAPEFSIYHDDISVVDPSGVQLSGLNSYKQSFRFAQSVASVFYDRQKSMITHRMVYDWARQSIRISWNAMIVPKVVGNRRNALYVDGVSMYKLDTASGKIIEHRIENIIVNNKPLSPPYPIQDLLTSALLGSGVDRRVPAGVGAGAWGAVLEQQYM
mmetsp:Transcript_37623/g.82394  ORF Transcript_37623/g.82394 Transcript_37623/m.82394 type:complete len:287 (-) Transcript_37623:117-977(-)|eukprot:CAMPEP_0178483152 /NCGR_PEP_ID=MMETSP0696-20121128/7087_1 /TAXON_ID=265572 /ORGANISM="Extubocellulus spinifer, Strain CCMP396" /LENGTH=286 /DNA_ID=CAMNT_0020110661 /DNA_START=161 /DNA_END=1021 /DNA_ORIENTATION=+